MKRILSILFLSVFVNVYVYSQCPVDAGSSQTACASQISVPMVGSSNGVWSTSGTGNFIPNNSDPFATYNLTSSDITAGSVIIYRSSSIPVCKDSMIITIAAAPVINVGPHLNITVGNPVLLNVNAPTGSTFFWQTTGTANFNQTIPNPTYSPTSADIANGSIVFFVTVTGPAGGCSTTDTVGVSFHPPIVPVNAVAGAYLDSTFNVAGPIKGKKELDITPGNSDEAIDLAVDASGNVTVLGRVMQGDFFVSKLRTSGDLDTSFANLGTHLFNLSNGNQSFNANCIARQPNGKILVAGSRDTSSGNTAGFIIRLNGDGTIDNSFGINGLRIYKLSSNSVEITKIKTLANGQIIVAGMESFANPFVARLNTNGNFDNGFNNGQGFYIETFPGEGARLTGLDVKYNTGEVIISVDFATTQFPDTYIIKFTSNGNKDLSFDNTGSGNYVFTNPPNSASGGISFQPDGKILLGTRVDTNLVAYRLMPNGDLDTAFGNNGLAKSPQLPTFSASCNNILIDGLGRVIITGNDPSLGYVAVRFKNNGVLDSNFALNGMYSDNSSTTKNCVTSAISTDNKVLLAGSENGDFATVLRIANTLSWHLIGNQFVLPNSSESYEAIAPSSWGYNYTWEYTGSNYYFIPVQNPNDKKVLIYFTDNATSGKLICKGFSGGGKNLMVTQSLDIKINTKASQARLLASVQCTPEVTDCSNNYISRFKLNDIDNDSSLCQSTGYSDYTRTGWMDTLIAGSVYTVQVRTESTDPLKHAAIWIDYNNDGFFDANQEFVAVTEGTGSELNFQNIIIKNSEGYTGPKRLRVRCKPNALTGRDACPISGELGETEDYLIIINGQDELEAPQIITPNEDGKNDFFVIRGIDALSDNALTIFDRYGKTIYSSTQYQNDWDGMDNNGDKVSPGTYYYYFKNNDNHIRGFLEVRY